MSDMQTNVSGFRFGRRMGLFNRDESQNENALLILLHEEIPRTAPEKRQKENGEGILDGRKQRDS